MVSGKLIEVDDVIPKIQMVQQTIQTPPWEVEYTRTIDDGQELLIRHQNYPDARVWLYFYKNRLVEVQPGWQFPDEGATKTYAYRITDDRQLRSMALDTYEGLELATQLPPYLSGLTSLFEEVSSMEDRSPPLKGIRSSIRHDGKSFALRSAPIDSS